MHRSRVETQTHSIGLHQKRRYAFDGYQPATWTQAVRDMAKGIISDLVVGGGGRLPVNVVEVDVDDEYS